MKYEFKPFNGYTFKQDSSEGWHPVFRNRAEYNNQELLVTLLPECAEDCSRVVVVEVLTGDVTHHGMRGEFSRDKQETCLDLLLRREVKKPAERTAHGVAYLTEKGVVTLVRSCEAHLAGLEDNPALTPIPCTITLHEQN